MLEKTRQSDEDAYLTDVAAKYFVAMALKNTSMDSHEDATACY